MKAAMASALDKVISPDDQKKIVDAIKAAERKSSGEIHVHVEAKCPDQDAYQRATSLFESLGLTQTRERNGVLIYVATRDRKFAFIGDTGIHEAVGSAFWSEAVAGMSVQFRQGQLGPGIVQAIDSIGEHLHRRFPHRADDRNELSDEISTDESNS